MSKFKVGDKVKIVNAFRNNGLGGTVVKIDDNKIYCDWNDGDMSMWVSDSSLELVTDKPEKPAKKHTETERRKAAKDVRAQLARLNVLIEKAKQVGIDVDKDMMDDDFIVDMSFQPQTPRKRVY